jgi:hypothetical protein
MKKLALALLLVSALLVGLQLGLYVMSKVMQPDEAGGEQQQALPPVAAGSQAGNEPVAN